MSGQACQDCTALTQSCNKGACDDCSGWTTPFPNKHLADIKVDSGGIIYVSGSSGDSVYLASLDSCGNLLDSNTHLPAGFSSAGATDMSLVGDTIWLGGNLVSAADPQNGMLAQYSRTTLDHINTNEVVGSGTDDEIFDIVHAGSTLWMIGTRSLTSTVPGIWGVKKDLNDLAGSSCSFLLLEETGAGRGISTDGHHIYFTGTQNSSMGSGRPMFLARHAITDCSTYSCQDCQVSWHHAFLNGTESTEGRALLALGGSIYVAGFSLSVFGDYTGVVFKIDATTGVQQNIYTYNATASGEGFLEIITDGTFIYALGTRNSSNTGLDGQPVIIKLRTSDLGFEWELAPSGDIGSYASASMLDSSSFVFIGGTGPDSRSVRRCLTSGSCP